MKEKYVVLIILFIILTIPIGGNASQTVRFATINWEPYTGEKLTHHGFFSQLVAESFSRVGVGVEFHYRPWARAIMETREGRYDGLMVVYWKKDRAGYLEFSDVVWKVKEEFICLASTPVAFDGTPASLQNHKIGVLNQSLQAQELEEAGINIHPVSDQVQNVQLLEIGRIDAVLIPRSIFFYHWEKLVGQKDRPRVTVLTPPYKIYDMYVAFSKQRPGFKRLRDEFNRGLRILRQDGGFDRILKTHDIRE